MCDVILVGRVISGKNILEYSKSKNKEVKLWLEYDMITNRNKKKKLILTKLLYNSKCYTDKAKICDKLNEYFVLYQTKLPAKFYV